MANPVIPTRRRRGNPNIAEAGKLTRFQPGHERPVIDRSRYRSGMSITRLVRDELGRPAEKGSPVTKAQKVAEMVVTLAQSGDLGAIKMVWAYTDGEPRAANEMTLRELAEHLAERLGLDAKELLSTFERELGAA
jgi:cation diffusion facilitator CzcD-associated flavoprotein CzcO